MNKKSIYTLMVIFLAGLFLFGCQAKQASTGNSQNTMATENPASIKCIADGGADKILYASDGSQYGLCLFNDGTVCEEWAYYRGTCKQGECARTCGAIGSRSEGWYDCHGNLLFWDKCAGENVTTAGTC
jgi:putative hemolysin